jgi:hypothetical protein
VLSQITLGENLIPPGGISVQELRKYLEDLVARLSRLAFPKKSLDKPPDLNGVM